MMQYSPLLLRNEIVFVDMASILWCQADFHSEDNLPVDQRLSEILVNVTTFNDAITCEEYIRRMSVEDRFVLIIDDEIGDDLIRRIHDLHQVLAIYILAVNNANLPWTEQFLKVRRNDRLTDAFEDLHQLRFSSC